MDYVRLGNTGLKVSRLCLGCMTYGSPKWRPWVLDEEQSLPFFKAAIEKGINFFDTADVYSQGESERVTGKALKEYAKRHEVVIATKVNGAMGADPNNHGLSRKHIMDGIDRSLHRLGVDYVDLYQIHRFDYETPIEETLEARREDPLKILKVSNLDEVAQKKWKAYSKARDVMLVRTHTGYAPWIVVHTDKKKKARLAVISYLLHTLAPSKIHEHAPAPDPGVLFEFDSQAIDDGRLDK